jgi:hypothetical protein
MNIQDLSNPIGYWAFFSVLAVVFLYLLNLQQETALRGYWDRKCTGREWRRAYPFATKHEIRKFLSNFVTAFGFKENRRLCFRPSDKVMEIYNTLYSTEGEPDGMELEDLVETVRHEYGFNLVSVWREEMTLGDIFDFTRRDGQVGMG